MTTLVTFIIIVHVAMCLGLIMVVLLQTGKGADMGAAFGGGGSQTLFGSSGASTFLSKATTVAAVIFMLTCFSLAYISTHQKPKSIIKDTKATVEETVPEKASQDAIPTEPASAAKPTSEK